MEDKDLIRYVQNKRRDFDKNEHSDDSDVISSTSGDTAENSEDEKSLYKKGGYYEVQLNQILCNKFKIKQKLGRGHFSTVWECSEKNNENKIYAVKIQKSKKCYREAALEEMLFHEIFKKKDHEYKVYINAMLFHNSQKGPNGKHYCMFFPLMRCDLVKYMGEHKDEKLTLDESSKLAYQLLCGCVYLHDICNVVHTDIKPENILIKSTDNGILYQLADFGTSCAIGDRECDYLQTTHYRSPEIIMGYKEWGSGIDIWSLACVLFEVITGYFMFEGDIESDFILHMIETLGKPPHKFLDKCKHTRSFYTRDGRFKYASELQPVPMFRVLMEEHSFEYDTTVAISRLLDPMLIWNPDERWSAAKLLTLYPQNQSEELEETM